MTRSNQLALAIGLAGVLAGFALASLLTPHQTSALPSTTREVAAAGLVEPNPNTALLDKIQRLEALLGAQANQRTEARPAAAPEPPNQEPPTASELDQQARDLLALVQAEYRSDAFAAAVENRAHYDSPDGAARALFSAYMNSRRPYDAERVLGFFDRLGVPNKITPWELNNLGLQYKQLGDTARAARLFVQALQQEPGNGDYAQQLAELDPAAGLTALLELNANGKLLESSGGRNNMALLMLESGDLDGAIAALHADDASVDFTGWELYLEHAPERAIAEMRSAAKADPYGSIGVQLANYFGDNEREDEALAALEDVLERNPGNMNAVECLAELAPERSLELYAANLAATPGAADVWQLYAEQLKSMGRLDEAVDAGLEAFRLGSEDWAPDYLLEAAPNEVLRQYETRVTGSLDDELWGDYADTLWRTGHLEEALAAWEHARRIDGDDSEWIGKLKAVKAGTNPFDDDEVPFVGGIYMPRINSLPSFTEE